MKDLQKLLGQFIVMTYLIGHPSDQMTGLINTERGKESLGALYQNKLLQLSAQNKANDFSMQDYISHISPQGKTPWDLIRNAEYQYNIAGENLARGYNNQQEIVNAWMNSPTHRENILDPKFKDIGTGITNQYTVQHFGVRNKPTILDYLMGRMKND